MFAIGGASARPTNPQLNRIEELEDETMEAMAAYDRLMDYWVNPLNDILDDLPQLVIGDSE